MGEYLNSARKYRPNNFDKIVGQDNIVKILRSQVISNSLHNSYLFCGSRGTGKTTTARVLAKAINCKNSNKNNGNPCLNCEFCNKSNNLGIFELDAASNNSVEDIRNIISQIRFTPIFNKYSVFIIDEVHMLSQAAFNSFLKTLEEPPKNTLFILATTEYYKVPATIVSRCQTFHFNNIDNNIIIDELKLILNDKNINFDEQSLEVIADKANGSLRDALSILDSVICYDNKNLSFEIVKKVLNILDDEVYFKIFDFMLNGDISNVLSEYNNIIINGFSEYDFFDGLIQFFLNLYLSKKNETCQLINKSDDSKKEFKKKSTDINIENLEKIIKLINKYSINYKIAINQKLFMDVMLIEICELLR